MGCLPEEQGKVYVNASAVFIDDGISLYEIWFIFRFWLEDPLFSFYVKTWWCVLMPLLSPRRTPKVSDSPS